MATRSFVIVYAGSEGHQAGNYLGIYIHNNGSPTYNGRLLQENYASFEAAHSLMALGNLSLLAEKPGKCDAYGRDWGRKGQEARVFGSIIEAIRAGQDADADYIYVWNEVLGEWQVASGVSPGARLQSVTELY